MQNENLKSDSIFQISQATILSEAAKYLKSIRNAQGEGDTNLDTMRHNIEQLNQEIE